MKTKNKVKIKDSELRDVLTNPVPSSSNHYVADCPYCGKNQHFYINRKTQLFDCKKCGEAGNIISLLKHLGKLYILGEFKSINRKHIDLLFKETNEEELEELTKEEPTIELPIGFKRIYGDKYLKSRKIEKRNFKDYKIGYTDLIPSLKDYIIFVVEEEGQCKGYVSRYTKEIKDKKTLRYRNSKKSNFSNLLYGYDDITNKTNTVIILEGIIDKITLDNFYNLQNQEEIKTVVTFGKKISKKQLLKLVNKEIENVILIYDKDAIKEMKKYSLLMEDYFNVLVGFTNEKDINASSREDIELIFKNLKSPRDFNRKIVKML